MQLQSKELNCQRTFWGNSWSAVLSPLLPWHFWKSCSVLPDQLFHFSVLHQIRSFLVNNLYLHVLQIFPCEQFVFACIIYIYCSLYINKRPQKRMLCQILISVKVCLEPVTFVPCLHWFCHLTSYFSHPDRSSNPSPPSEPSSTSSSAAPRSKGTVLDQQKGKRPLQRSQSMTLPTKKPSSSGSGSTSGQPNRGPLMSICCDCKGMIMEIIRASKTSLAMIQPGDESAGTGSFSPSSASPSSPSSKC